MYTRLAENTILSYKGIIYYPVTGCLLRLLPSCCGSKSIIWYWIRKLSKDDTCEKLWQQLVDYTHHSGCIDISHQSIDCSIIKAPSGGEKHVAIRFTSIHMQRNDLLLSIRMSYLIGCALVSATRYDSRLSDTTISSIQGALEISREPCILIKRMMQYLAKPFFLTTPISR